MGNVRLFSEGFNPSAHPRAQEHLPEIPKELVSADYALDNDRRESLPALKARMARARRRALDRADPRQTTLRGVLDPNNGYRRHSAGGKFESWRQLDVELDHIDKFKNREGFWRKGGKAREAMAHVRAQTFSAIELGGLDEVLPVWMRGRWALTRAQTAILIAVMKAFRFKAGGVMEREPVLASDLGISERAFRYALNGRRYTVADGSERWSPGLIERGLVYRRQLKRPGTDGRRTDDDVLLLRVGPVVEKLMRPTMAASPWIEATDAQRTKARDRLQKLRRQGRAMRRTQATEAWGRRQQWRVIKSAAQCADNPASPPMKGGRGRLGLTRGERHKPSQSPRTPRASKNTNVSPPKQRQLDNEALCKASRPAALLPRSTDHDQNLRATEGDRRRRRAQEGGLEIPAEFSSRPIHQERTNRKDPDLNVWRARRARGVRVPPKIAERLFDEDCAKAYSALFGAAPQASPEGDSIEGSPPPSERSETPPAASVGPPENEQLSEAGDRERPG